MSAAHEYLEAQVQAAYQRELDAGENVVRSLPFFATSLGVLATAIGLSRDAIGPPAWSGFGLAIYATLAAIGLGVLAVLSALLRAVRPRQLRQAPAAADLIAHAGELRGHYERLEPSKTAVDQAVADDLRKRVVEQTAAAATDLRRIGKVRQAARGRAMALLVTTILLAFVMLGLILSRDALRAGGFDV